MKSKQPKILFILHRSPPAHGAANVGDFIANSKFVNTKLNSKFITITSSVTLRDIGKQNIIKYFRFINLFCNVALYLIIFRPSKIYFTASVGGPAFMRDLVLSVLWKCYAYFTDAEIFYHYHTSGIEEFVDVSPKNKKLVEFYIKNVNLILLSPFAAKEFYAVTGFKNIFYLPNGVSNPFQENKLEKYLNEKDFSGNNILYLSNMIPEKGYLNVLNLAKDYKGSDLHFHFAGNWQSESDKDLFFRFVKDSDLEGMVTHHGFVTGEEKQTLFQRCNLFIFPTKYKKEAFPLSIIEALSYGIPCISTHIGGIPFILNEKCGLILKSDQSLIEGFEFTIKNLITIETARYCHAHYLKNFSLEKFETDLVRILS